MIAELRRNLVLILVIATLFFPLDLNAQDNISLQVKTFDQDLKPLPNIQLALNDLAFFTVNNKGTAIIEVEQSDLPVKTIRIKDERYEAASWNLSKGTIEIIVRPVSYKTMHVTTRFADGSGLANTAVTFHGTKTLTVASDQSGKFDLMTSLYEKITSAGQFEIDNILVTGMTVNGDAVVLTLERPRVTQAPKQTVDTTKPEIEQINAASLDSIKSLADFYKIFSSISMSSLDESSRLLVDKKFRELIALRQDSIRASQPVYIKGISDTSLIAEDIRNLLKQATSERNTFSINREEFEKKIVVISSKLQRGIKNLSEKERNSLLHDIDNLEMLLTENESQFFKNQNDYREIITTLREKYLEVETLQHQLSEAERLRIEQDREFRQRIIVIGSIVVLFGLLIILLITFSSRLRRQTKSLQTANARIEEINENLEAIVAKRTQLLEEANKELDTFLYRASHDLRAPAISLMGLVQIIEHIEKEEMVHHIRNAVGSMNRVINKLVEISEISQEAENIKTIDVADTLRYVCNKYLLTDSSSNPRFGGMRVISARPLQLIVDCDPGIRITTSKSLFESIVGNLVDNAIFFGGLKKATEPAQVKVKAEIKNENLELTVYDNGVGITKESRPKIFNMFYKGDEDSKGSGLGLYTVDKCVAALHGAITFESEEGKYTKFFVVIPSVKS